MIDLTLDDPRQRSSVGRLRELCRVREVLLDFLVGPNQYGSTEATLQRYFDAFAVAARQIAKLDGVKIIEQENVPETSEVEKVMESMIRLDGARALFPTSFGFWPLILKTAPKNPEVLFVHAGGLWKDGANLRVVHGKR